MNDWIEDENPSQETIIAENEEFNSRYSLLKDANDKFKLKYKAYNTFIGMQLV